MDNMEEKYFLTRGKAILFGLLIIIVIIIFIVLKVTSTNSKSKYKEFESELKSAAENYYIIRSLDIDDGEEIKISKKTLENSNLIYNELKDKCDGYVVISSEKNIALNEYEISYLPYIKCGNKYMTSNYSEY